MPAQAHHLLHVILRRGINLQTSQSCQCETYKPLGTITGFLKQYWVSTKVPMFKPAAGSIYRVCREFNLCAFSCGHVFSHVCFFAPKISLLTCVVLAPLGVFCHVWFFLLPLFRQLCPSDLVVEVVGERSRWRADYILRFAGVSGLGLRGGRPEAKPATQSNDEPSLGWTRGNFTSIILQPTLHFSSSFFLFFFFVLFFLFSHLSSLFFLLSSLLSLLSSNPKA